MNLIILEIKAHEAGHYTYELNQFCKHVEFLFNSIYILTPFGFKDKWEEVKNCKIINLCNENSKTNNFSIKIVGKLYGYQWEFYKYACKFISDFSFKENIIHIWDVISIFPLWYFLSKIKNLKILNLKSVYREQTAILGSNKLGKIQGMLSKKLLKRIGDKYVVHTGEIFDEAVKIGINPIKIIKIGIGIENSKIYLSKEDARRKLRLPNDIFLILFFGVIREEKGIYELFEHIRNINYSFMLLIVGENKLDKSLEKIALEYGIKDKIILYSQYIPELKLEKYFRACDSVIVCHRDNFKGESGVLLKAIQYQIPIIANTGGNSAKIVESEKIGSVFDISRHNDLIRAISFIKNNRNIIEEKLLSAKKKYSWQRIIPLFQKVYFLNE